LERNDASFSELAQSVALFRRIEPFCSSYGDSRDTVKPTVSLRNLAAAGDGQRHGEHQFALARRAMPFSGLPFSYFSRVRQTCATGNRPVINVTRPSTLISE
jgi:hypothetical protein